MEIINLNENVYQFSFFRENSQFPFNITVFIDGKSAIIVDVAYEIYAEQVKQYLLSLGVTEYIIFISHHHEDHFDGCKSFKDSITYASKLFQVDYQEHLESDAYLKSFIPSKYIIDGIQFNTNKYQIEFFYTPGHNKCEYSFLINSKYLYVGDLIFYNKEGLPSIPYIDVNSNIEEYIDSLEMIKSINHEIMLFGHGRPLENKKEIIKQIENSLFYLKQIQYSNGVKPVEECILNHKSFFSGLNFHESNLKKSVVL